MSETPTVHEVLTQEPNDYDIEAATKLAKWVHSLAQHAADKRKTQTHESNWDRDLEFIVASSQWEGPLPSYRRPITVNIWRRAYHILLAVLTGGRPILKLIPQGMGNPQALEVWQHALWSVLKTESVIEKWTEALSWGLLGDGGWLKVGYGCRDVLQKQPDVLVSCPHPNKIVPDPDCSDITVQECSYIIYRDILDIGTITRRYPEQGWRVKPDASSIKSSNIEDAKESLSIAPAGGWTQGAGISRARAEVFELWIDDSTLEYVEDREPDLVVNEAGELSLTQTKRGRWVPKYPFGRVITCTREVVLRDIPNPFGQAFGWNMRWPFVFVPGAEAPHRLWRPGLCSNLVELQKAINRSMSLLLENAIKVTNALVVADEQAMDEEDWKMLSLVPGAKILKRRGTEVKVVFPQPLPPQAYQLPDYLIKKLEEVVGLHDPPIAPGQAVAAKTVSFLQQKGHFLLGEMAKLGEQSLERIGMRIVGLQRQKYLPGRIIPMFTNERITQPAQLTWPELPAAMEVRIEASSGWAEVMAGVMAKAEEAKAGGKKRGGS
jgi:hypothetical protein